MLFVGPVFFLARIALFPGANDPDPLRAFRIRYFLLGHQLPSLQAAGDYVVGAAAVLTVRATVTTHSGGAGQSGSAILSQQIIQVGMPTVSGNGTPAQAN